MIKKSLAVIFIVVSVSLYSQAIKPTGHIGVSIYTGNSEQVYYDNTPIYRTVTPKYSLKTDITAGANILGFINLSTTILTYSAMPESGEIFFSPYQNDYFISASVYYGDFTLGIEHACYHPVCTAGDCYRAKYGGYNELFVRWEW